MIEHPITGNTATKSSRFIDPPNLRAKLMLEAASAMVEQRDWPFRETVVEMRSQEGEEGCYRFLGANKPESIQQVYDRALDISIMNPCAILAMAHRGVGLFSHPMEVALIAVLPHDDQLGFAVNKASGLTSLDDVRERRFPLRLSVRGSADACVTLLVEQVLKVHGFDFQDLLSWGGSISYDQEMPLHPSRLGRVAAGELDAIFDEAVVMWANKVEDAGMRLLAITEGRLAELEAIGFRRSTIPQARYERLPTDVATVDFSGWPVYTRHDASNLLVRKFCEALMARKRVVPWHMGPTQQEELPLARMVVESRDTPIDLPFHPAAQAFWTEEGYLQQAL